MMIAKSMMTVLVGSTLLATAALAQSPATSTAPPPAERMAPAATTMSHHGQWRASKVVGLKIYNDGNESLGSVNDLLLDNQGRITTAVVGVGGFLGMGERYVAVPFEKIKWVDTPAPAATASANGMTGRTTTTTTTTTGVGTTTGAATTATTPAKADPWYPDHGVLSVTKDELKAMPEFKYST